MTYISNTPNPPSFLSPRVVKEGTLSNQTTTQTVYTVTAGKTLYVTNISLVYFNTSTSTSGDVRIQDNTIVKIPFICPPTTLGNNPATQGGTAIAFAEPRKFTINFRVVVVSGTITHNGVTYKKDATFTAVNANFTGSGVVRYNVQKRKMTVADEYPMSHTMTDSVIMQILTKELALDERSKPELKTDGVDDTVKE